MRDRFNRFMQGRYGIDQLGKTMLITGLVSMVLSALLTRWWALSLFLDAVALGNLVMVYFRMFSRNYAARSEENRRYLEKSAGLRRRFGKAKYDAGQRKEYHIYKCPECGQKIRIPRKDGRKVEIDCPKCHTKFIKRC